MRLLRRDRRTLRAAVAVSVSVAVSVVLSGCSSGKAAESPASLLKRAGTALDGTPSIHFTLSSADVPSGGSRLVGGSGVASHVPPAFQGKLSVLIGSGTVSVEVLSVGGTVYAKVPFTTVFKPTDPQAFGLTDPAKLVDPDTGLTRLLADSSGLVAGGEARIDNDVVEIVKSKVPGKTVGEVLTDADPATPVDATFYITKDSGQLRRAVLTGPFFEKGKTSTYTLVLTQYGAKVSISAPPKA